MVKRNVWEYTPNEVKNNVVICSYNPYESYSISSAANYLILNFRLTPPGVVASTQPRQSSRYTPSNCNTRNKLNLQNAEVYWQIG